MKRLSSQISRRTDDRRNRFRSRENGSSNMDQSNLSYSQVSQVTETSDWLGNSGDYDNAGKFSAGSNSSIGIDPMTMSLNWLEKKATSSTSAPSGITQVAKNNPKLASKQPYIRGLHVKEAVKPTFTLSEALSDSRRLTAAQLEIIQQYSPTCGGHQMAAKLLTVNKTGPNKGRRFYVCTFPRDQCCEFFMWVEDNPDLLQLAESSKSKSDSDESYENFSLYYYIKRLATMTKDELVYEIRKLNCRIKYLKSAKRSIITIVGSKEDLMRKIVDEASWWIEEHSKRINAAFHSKISSQHSLLNKEQQLTREATISMHNKESNSDGMIYLSDSDDSHGPPAAAPSSGDRQQKVVIAVNPDLESDIISLTSESVDNSDLCHSADLDSLSNKFEISAKWYFGHKTLRQGQRWAIERACNGLNSLVVMPTGYGKSLCYLIPALLLPGLTLVVSPLIALMNDQINGLPPELPGACLTSQLNTQEAAEVCARVLSRDIRVLFVAPERLCANGFRRLMRQFKANGGVVSLVCLDEAHTLSAWSYNFRPAYFRVQRELSAIKPGAVMALTATAGNKVQDDILQALGIPSDGKLVLRLPRPNLQVNATYTASEEEKRAKLLEILKEKEANKDNASSFNKNRRKALVSIVYVWRRNEAEAIGQFLNASGVEALVYHGGLATDERETVQRRFDRGSVRCIVATVAFGMGIDKDDIRRIIHYSMPKSPENYLQEIGRAGRDGGDAVCCLLFDKTDAMLQHSLVHSSRISKLQLLGLLTTIYPSKQNTQKHPPLVKPAGTNAAPSTSSASASASVASSADDKDSRHVVVALPYAQLTTALDLSQANVETILSLLEGDPHKLVSIEGSYNNTIKGKFRWTGPRLQELVRSDPVAKALFIVSTTSSSSSSSSEQADLDPRSFSLFQDPTHSSRLSESHNRASHGMSEVYQFSANASEIVSQLEISFDAFNNSVYSLQKRGVIQYTWSDYCAVVTITRRMPTIAKARLEALNEVANSLYEKLRINSKQTAEKVMQMWRVGYALSELASSLSNYDTSAAQLFISDLLNSDEFDELEIVDDTTRELRVRYHAAPTPFIALLVNANANANTAEAKALALAASISKTIQNAARLISRDPLLVALCDNISRQCLRAYPQMPELLQIVQQERKNFTALAISRVLHGLDSPSLRSSYWSGGIYSDVWGHFKEYCFDEVFGLVYNIV